MEKSLRSEGSGRIEDFFQNRKKTVTFEHVCCRIDRVCAKTKHRNGYCSLVMSREVFFVSEGHRKPETYRANLCD